MKTVKQGIGVIIALLFFLQWGCSSAQAAAMSADEITAKSAIVIDATTGKVLYSKNSEELRYPASTTKMMSLIVALENGRLDDKITASPQAAATEGSSLWLEAGEQLTLRDLLYGMMLVSGNDATVAVAEHIAGSVEKFAEMMTKKAKEIGAVHTNFVNSSGLPDPNHVTTAHDLARIAAYGYKNPLFTQFVSTQHAVIPWAGKTYDRDLYNENRMLWRYEGANGVKTGYTDAAGRCLVSGAKRDGIQLVAVVLDSEQMWDDSIKLLDKGFAKVKPSTLLQAGSVVKTLRVSSGKTDTIKVTAADSLVVPVVAGEEEEFSLQFDLPGKIQAPVSKGQKVGTASVIYKGKNVLSVDLLADEDIEKKSLVTNLWTKVWPVLTYLIRNFS